MRSEWVRFAHDYNCREATPQFLISNLTFLILFDFFAADGAFPILKELQLAAPLAFAPYQKCLPADVALLTAHEGRTVAIGASRGERSAAPGADDARTLDGF
jgi:hypothetical protein